MKRVSAIDPARPGIQTDRQQRQRLPHYQPHYIVGAGPQGHADSDFMGVLRHGVGKKWRDTLDGGKNRSYQPEDGEQHYVRAQSAHLIFENIVEHSNFRHRHVGIDLADTRRAPGIKRFGSPVVRKINVICIQVHPAKVRASAEEAARAAHT